MQTADPRAAKQVPCAKPTRRGVGGAVQQARAQIPDPPSSSAATGTAKTLT